MSLNLLHTYFPSIISINYFFLLYENTKFKIITFHLNCEIFLRLFCSSLLLTTHSFWKTKVKLGLTKQVEDKKRKVIIAEKYYFIAV